MFYALCSGVTSTGTNWADLGRGTVVTGPSHIGESLFFLSRVRTRCGTRSPTYSDRDRTWRSWQRRRLSGGNGHSG
jgi:hypothetical protein